MYLPPEIILNILDHLDCTPDNPKNDRATIISLRSANKDFYAVVTPVLFRDFSLHYGVSRSISQMQAVSSSPMIRAYIRYLFIPSESFFPLGKDVQFNSKDHHPWSRGPVLDWLTANNYSQAAPVRKGVKGRRNHAEQTLMLHHPFREYPTRPWQKFTLGQKEFRKQHEEYSTALLEFVESCENLEEVHIAMGLGADTERMLVFGMILGRYLMPTIIAKGIPGLRISSPSKHGVTLPFKGYFEISKRISGKLFEFSSLESLVIKSCYGTVDRPSGSDFADMFQTLTGLTSFTFSMSGPLKCHSAKDIFGNPISIASRNLTKVTLGRLFLWQNDGHFETFLSGVPTLTELNLHQIVLQKAFRHTENHALLQDNWRAVFRHILADLPKLTAYKFGLLMYGASNGEWWTRFPNNAQLLLPATVRAQNLTSATWYNILNGTELLSPYEEDWKGLNLLRKVVRDRRLEQGLENDTYSENVTLPVRAEYAEDWVFVTDV